MQADKSVLVADSNPNARLEVADPLRRVGEFAVYEACYDAEVLSAVKQLQFDAIILDMAISGTGGRELCRALRRQGVESPILIVTDQECDAELILALDAGANDYVAKSARLPLLLARLRAHLRQYALSDHIELRIQQYMFRPRARVLVDSEGGDKILLTEKEAIFLKYLHRMRGKVVSREELLGTVWGYHPDVTTHTIETHIWRLRRKIERNAKSPKILVTEGGGYRLCIETMFGSGAVAHQAA